MAFDSASSRVILAYPAALVGCFLWKRDKVSAAFLVAIVMVLVALEYLAIVEEEELLENVRRVGTYLQEQLQALAGRQAAVKEVRGRGLIQGLQLAIPARPIVEEALAEGVLFNSTQDSVLRFLPPFLLQEKHVDKGMRVLKKLLRKKRPA